jgi:hypothetical protein
MKKGRGLALLLAGAMLPALAGCLLPPDAPTVLASAGGTGPDDAWFVYSPDQQQEVLRLLGVEVRGRSIHMIDGTTYEVMTVEDVRSGERRVVWFNISRFFRRIADGPLPS